MWANIASMYQESWKKVKILELKNNQRKRKSKKNHWKWNEERNYKSRKQI